MPSPLLTVAASPSVARVRARRRRAALVCAAVLVATSASIAPAQAATLEKGFWGPTQVGGVSQFPIYKQLGVTTYQTTLSWAATAPTRPANPRDPADPAYLWPADIDDAIAQASANRMKVLIMAAQTPPWANGGQAPGYAPTNPSDYADFISAASKR